MKTETMKEVLDLARTLNFTQTARNRFITQPALSRHIAAFEAEIDVQVFNRQQHGVKLTEEGAVVVKRLQSVVDAYDAFLESVDIVKDGYRERLRVGYLVAASRPFIAHASALFEKRFPNVYVEYDPMSPRDIRDALREGRIDLAFTADTFISLHAPFASEPIYKDEYCIAVGRESDLANKKTIRLEDLGGREVSMPASDFAPTENEIYRKVFGRIPYTPSRRKHRSIEDVSVVLSSGEVCAPMLEHARFYGERGIALIPFEDNPFEPAHIIAVWNTQSGVEHVDDFVTCAHEGLERMKEKGF